MEGPRHRRGTDVARDGFRGSTRRHNVQGPIATRERLDELIAILEESVAKAERARRAESLRRYEVARLNERHRQQPARPAAPKLRIVAPV